MSEPDDLLALADEGLRRAKAKGAEHAEVFLWKARKTAAEASGAGSSVTDADQSGVAVRVAVGSRVSGSASSGLLAADVAWAVDQALATARLVPESKKFQGFAPPSPGAGAPTAVDERVAEPDPERLVADAERAAEAARAGHVTYFSAGLVAQSSLFVVANTAGVATWDRNAYEFLHLETRSRGYADKYATDVLADRRPLSESHDLAAVARDAVARAQSATSPGRLPGVVRDVVFDAKTAHTLVQHFAASFSGATARSGRSRLAGELGKEIANPLLGIRDEARGPRGCRNQRIDDEGTPTSAMPIVERGVLRNLLYDHATGAALGVGSNGHGLRPVDVRYSGGVGVKPANLEVAPGDHTLDELVEGVERGVLVRDALMGTFTMNNLTGDFSFVAPLAFHVENGKVRGALVSTTVAGNLFDAMRNLVAVGKEARSFRTGRSVPLAMTGVTCAT